VELCNSFDYENQIKVLMEREFFLKNQALLFDDMNLNYLSSELRKEADIFKQMREDLKEDLKISEMLSMAECEKI